jgi:ubiquitin thioesterase CYLD
LIQDPKRCFICHKLATYLCKKCNLEYEEKFFCEKHYSSEKNKCKKEHSDRIKPIRYETKEDHYCEQNAEIPTIKLSLFAVLCIDTSHYVAFLKTGLKEKSPWVFYDSMSDRRCMSF